MKKFACQVRLDYGIYDCKINSIESAIINFTQTNIIQIDATIVDSNFFGINDKFVWTEKLYFVEFTISWNSTTFGYYFLCLWSIGNCFSKAPKKFSGKIKILVNYIITIAGKIIHTKQKEYNNNNLVGDFFTVRTISVSFGYFW